MRQGTFSFINRQPPSFICELPAQVYIPQMISLSFHLFFSLSLPLLRWLLKSHTYWEAKATVLHNFISFYLRDVPEVCNAIVLQEAFLIDSKILRDFPCLSNLEAAKLITSSGVALYMCLCLVALVISDSFETP